MRFLPLLFLLSATAAAQVASNPSGCSPAGQTVLVDCTNGSTPIALPVEFTVGPIAPGAPAVFLFGLEEETVSVPLGIPLGVDLGPGFGVEFSGCALFASGLVQLSTVAGVDGVARLSVLVPPGFSPIVVQGLVADPTNALGVALTSNYLHYFPN